MVAGYGPGIVINTRISRSEETVCFNDDQVVLIERVGLGRVWHYCVWCCAAIRAGDPDHSRVQDGLVLDSAHRVP